MAEQILRNKGGRPKGTTGIKWAKTLEKEHARELARQQITAHLGRVLNAQIVSAIGIGHVYTRDEKGRYRRCVSHEEIETLLESGEEGKHFFIATKDPSVEAAKVLIDRALDKPKEQAQDVNLNVSGDLTAQIAEGRQRAADRNRKARE